MKSEVKNLDIAKVSDMDSIVAKNVKRILREKGYKQGAFAERAGYKPKTFSNMLNGRKLITAVDVIQICTAAGVTPNQLFKADQQSAGGLAPEI